MATESDDSKVVRSGKQTAKRATKPSRKIPAKAHVKKEIREREDFARRQSLVAFRADAEVLTAILKLTAAVKAEVRGLAGGNARAVALRRAILESAERLPKTPVKSS